jgi:hypothetical protein
MRAASHTASLPLLSELSQSCLKKIEQNNIPMYTDKSQNDKDLLKKME